MSAALAIVFLVLGIACQFMLTMEKFTSGIMGIGFLSVSVTICIYKELRSREAEDKDSDSRTVLLLAILMILIHAVQFPRNYQIEMEHRQHLEELRQRIRQANTESKLRAEQGVD